MASSGAVKRDLDWKQYIKKNGKPGKRWVLTSGPLYCPLDTCERCGKIDSVSWVYSRSDVAGYDVPDEFILIWDSRYVLCMSCWNKVKPIMKQLDFYCENRALINKLEGEIRNAARKDSNNRTLS